jgi:RNA polymerase sigma-70 factor (ECF subfamily)
VTQEQQDAEVIRGSLNEPEAFGRIFDRHAVSVHRFLASRSDPTTADDLLGEVFATAFGLRWRFDGRHDTARPWLLGIAANVLRQEVRRRGRESRTASRLPTASLDDLFADADDRLVAAGGRRSLRSALAALPAPDRDVLLLVAWDGLTPAEAAASLGIPQGTARSRLHRARQALQHELSGLRPDTHAKER